VDKEFTVSLATIQSGWNLAISPGTSLQTYRRLMVKENAMITVHPGDSPIKFVGIVGVQTTGTLTVHGRDCTIEGDLFLSGTFNISSSTVRVSQNFVFTEGYIGGVSSSLYINKLGNITGNSQKTIEGTTLYVDRPSQSADNGVIAEYFQYRVSTDTTKRIQNLYYFPEESSGIYTLPKEFDMPQTEPNKMELLSSFDRLPQYYGNSPIAMTSTFGWFDTSSSESFTYGYACRLWAFLEISSPGLYVFYITTGYGLHIRLWINDDVVFLSDRYRPFLAKQSTDPQLLQSGRIRIRVDFIQRSSLWTSENALVLTYAGPDFLEKPLPTSRLFARALSTESTVEYANPSFNTNDTAKLFPTYSTMTLSGVGLIFARNGANVVISQTGILDVVDDITWVSHSSFSGKSMIINSGMVIRSGIGGVATFFADYRDQGGSLLKRNGMIEFKDATRDGGLALWNNPNGGSWLDPNNWIPTRVPNRHDIVHITLEGDYAIVIPEGRTVYSTSLMVGYKSSNPQLVVGRYSVLSISDRLDIYSDNITIRGKVTAENVAWRGESMFGAGFPGEIVATNMDVIKGTYEKKYFSNIAITTVATLTIDTSLNSQNYELHCVDCVVINGNGSIALANSVTWKMERINWISSPMGLVNYGLVVFELSRCCSANIYWDVHNYGEVKVVTKNYGSSYTMNVYGLWLNYNVTNVYLTHFYLQGARPPAAAAISGSSSGVWNVYGYPVRYEYASDPVGDRLTGTWREYLSDVYQNASDLHHTLWNPGKSISYRFSPTGYISYSFGHLNSFGRVTVYFTHSPSLTITFSGDLITGRHGKLHFMASSSPLSATSSLTILQNNELTAGDILISRGWNVTVSERSNATFYRSATLHENSALIVRSASTLSFGDHLVMFKNSLLDFSGDSLRCSSSWISYGLVVLGRGRVTIYGRWEMYSGAVKGSGATIYAHGGWNVSGDTDKILKGINIYLVPLSSLHTTKNGVIAEYFQYRVDTDHTRREVNFLRLERLPEPVYAVPNIQRTEHSLHRYPILYGSSPLHYSRYDGIPSLDDPESFTYQYGGRLWMYLRIDMPGDYKFYFLTGYSLVYRLWIDESAVYTSNSYNKLLNLETVGPLRLQHGYTKLRIDFVQRSSYWRNTGNTFILYYSGPNFDRKVIPSDKIYYHNGFSYAKRTFEFPTSSTASISGGPIVAQESVNLTICNTCKVQILDGITWYSERDSLLTTRFINFGSFIRKGEPGTATIFGKYVPMPGGSKQSMDGAVLEFRDDDPSGNLVTWNNPYGGSWMNPSNWSPRRIPRPQDIVHITHPGSYRVTISVYSAVNIAALTVGSYQSSGELVIESGTTLMVSGLLEIHSQHFTVRGLLLATKMLWYGQFLSGSSSYEGKIIITSSLNVIHSDTVYLQYITIENRGEMTIGCREETNSYYCADCVIYNYGTLLVSGVSRMNYQQRSDDKTGIINYGVLTFEFWTNPSYSANLNLYWDFENNGNISVISKDNSRGCVLHIYGSLTNHGNIFSYMATIYVHSSAQIPMTNGSWEMFGKPYRESNLPNPPAYRQSGSWQPYLENVYQNLSADEWDTGNSFTLSLSSIYAKHIFFNSLQFHGPYRLRVLSSGLIVLSFQTLLSLGQHSELLLGTATSASSMICGSHSNIILNKASIGSGWTFNVTDNSTFFALGRVVMLAKSTVNFSSRVSAHFGESLYTSAGSKFVLADSHVTVSGKWDHLGDVMLQSSTVAVEGDLDWQLGSFKGNHGGYLRVQRLCKVSSTMNKRLSGVNMVISASERYREKHGVVAEYFQYRIATSLTSPISNVYRFPGDGSSSNELPPYFDYANATANVIRLEPRLNRHMRLNGNGPLAYIPETLNYDSTSTLTFTYSYAARLWTYLKIDHPGQYVFYFRSSYGVYLRLWVNDHVRFTSYRYNNYRNEEMSSSISLTTGLQKLRLDYIQRSTYWTSQGGTITVMYEGPHTPKQIIPNAKLYPEILSDGQPVGAAENWKFLPKNHKVCTSNLSLSDILLNYKTSFSHFIVEGDRFIADDGASITVEESGILEFKVDGNWPASASNDTLLTIKGMLTKTAGTGHTVITIGSNELSVACVKPFSGAIFLHPQDYSPSTIEASSQSTGYQSSPVDITRTSPTSPIPSDPNTWDHQDIYKFFYFLADGHYRQYASNLSEYTGKQLLQMGQDEFENLVPGDDGLLLYGALLAKARDTESHTSSSGLGAGAVAGILLSINAIVVIAIIVLRKWFIRKAKQKQKQKERKEQETAVADDFQLPAVTPPDGSSTACYQRPADVNQYATPNRAYFEDVSRYQPLSGSQETSFKERHYQHLN
jgi:hypothetical protein